MKPKVIKSSPLISWPHRIINNFFSEKELKWVEGYFEYGLKELRKKYWPLFDKDGNMLPGLKLQEEAHKHRIITPNTATNGFSVFVPFWSTERYIEVIDDIWKETVSRELRYPNLPPGSYKLMISYQKPDLTWSSPTTLFKIKIKVPFWEKLSFIILFLTLILLVIYLIILRLILSHRSTLYISVPINHHEYTC